MAGGESYAILLHWRLKPGKEQAFATAWDEVTRVLLGHGSFGSALFEAADGTCYALARWPDAHARAAASSASGGRLDAAYAAMADAIAETLPSVELTERINHWTQVSGDD